MFGILTMALVVMCVGMAVLATGAIIIVAMNPGFFERERQTTDETPPPWET